MAFWKILKNSVTTFLDNDPMTYASSLAFYTIISLPAILLLTINILSSAYEKDEIQASMLSQLNKYLGPTTVDQAEDILQNASLEYDGILPQIIGFAVLIFSATTVFISLQNGINRIWGVKPDPDVNIVKIFLDRVISFAMIVSIGFVMLVSFVVDSLLSILSDWLALHMAGLGFITAMIVNGVISLGVIVIIFAFVYKVLPDAKTKWKNVKVGAFFTAILFVLGKYLINLYLSSADVGSSYGASGSMVVFLFWVYYSSILILFGAKFTYAYTTYHEDLLTTDEHAVFVEENVVDRESIKAKLE